MKALSLAMLALFSLGAAAAPAANALHPSCEAAYADLRADKYAEAAAKLAECGASATPPTPTHTVVLYHRVQVLDQLGRSEEALRQEIALTDKAHFETGLADAFSGPGAWSRDPELVRARKATGIRRAELLLDIGIRLHQLGRAKEAIGWAERSARHAVNRYRPEGEFFPMDRDAGCAIALRGFARSVVDADKNAAWVDLARGYIRGCDSLPVGREIAKLDEGYRAELDEMKQRFETYQAEVKRVTDSIRAKSREAAALSAKQPDMLGVSLLIDALDRRKAVEPVLELRRRYNLAEDVLLEDEPLSEEQEQP